MKLPAGSMGLIPAMVQKPCAIGIDVRPGFWDTVILDLNRSPRGLWVPRVVFSGKLLDEDQIFWLMPQYGVICGVIDSRPEATLASRLQARAIEKLGIKMLRASYLTTPGDIKMQENTAEGILRLERTMTLDDVQYAIATGGLAIPENFGEISGGEFKNELMNSTKVPIRIQGKQWYAWENKGPDHTFHALNYAMVALYAGNLMHYGGDAMMGATAGIVESAFDKKEHRVYKDDEVDDFYDQETRTWVA